MSTWSIFLLDEPSYLRVMGWVGGSQSQYWVYWRALGIYGLNGSWRSISVISANISSMIVSSTMSSIVSSRPFSFIGSLDVRVLSWKVPGQQWDKSVVGILWSVLFRRTVRWSCESGSLMRRIFLIHFFNAFFLFKHGAFPSPLRIFAFKTSTAKFLWAAQTKKGTACKLM